MTYEAAIKTQLRDRLDSPSHDLTHLDTVLAYARSLGVTYGGDPDILTAAALLHDLGRNDPRLHGAASAARSAEMARDILAAVDFPPDRIEPTLLAIREHDQPDVRPASLEGRILKDADFLAGFGATGIVRAALWTGESGGTQADLLDRLERKMPARIASLEFEQSRQHARRDYLFVRLFLDRLHMDKTLRPLAAAPYVVIEGISGAGKSTQAKLLANRFDFLGPESLYLHEPTPFFKDVRDFIGADKTDRHYQTLLLLLDRYVTLRPQLETALANGQPIVADRSYLSTMVYQADPASDWLSAAHIAQLHSLLPQPTHLILLDLPADHAFARIEARGGERGSHETLELLRQHRERFLALRHDFPHMQVIDVTGREVDVVHASIWRALNLP